MGRRLGFSLVEILVVVSIVAILVAIILPVVIGARGTAEYSVCTSNFRQILQATEMYRSDNESQLPRLNPGGHYVYGPYGVRRLTGDILAPYLKTRDIYSCPSARKPRPLPVDYVFRCVLDFSEFNGNKSWEWRLDPHPSTVLMWDYNHKQNKPGFLDPRDVWLAGRSDGAVIRCPFGKVKKQYWLPDGTWSESGGNTPNAPAELVFPGEEWPPGLIEQK